VYQIVSDKRTLLQDKILFISISLAFFVILCYMDNNIPSGVYVLNQVDNLLLSYNLTSIINFPTRVQNTSAVAIYNIFIDISQF